MRLKMILVVFFGGLLMLGILFYFWHTSLWSLWESLPNQQADFAFAYDVGTGFNLEAYADQMPVAWQELTGYSSIVGVLSTTDKIAVSREGQNIIVVLLPSWRGQFTAVRFLKSNGWRVERFGLVLRASRANDSSKVERPKWPLIIGLKKSPIMVGEVGDKEWLVKKEGDGLLISAKNKGGEWQIFDANNLERVVKDEMRMIVPGSLLSELPGPAIRDWNDYLKLKTGLVESVADMFSLLSEFDRVVLEIDDETVFIGVEGNALEFSEEIRSWLVEEERSERIVTKAFRLPDGTLGYEKVPDEAQDVWQAIGPGECWRSVAERWLWQICTEGNKAAFTSDYVEREAVIDWEDDSKVVLGKDFLENLNIANLNSVRASGGEDWLQVYLGI